MKIILLTATFFLTALLSAQDSRYEKIEKNTMDGTKTGLRDKLTNKEILPAIYDKVIDLTQSKFAVVKDGKVGVVDTMNKILIPIQYIDVTEAMDDRIFISNGKKWAMCDENGKILTQFLYDEILGYNEGVVRVSNNNKIGYINKVGQVIFPCKFDEGYDCYGDFILIYGSTWESLGFDLVKKDITGKEVSRQNVGMSGKMPVLYNKKGQLIYKGDSKEKITYPPDFQIALVEKYIVSAGRTYTKVLDKNGKVLIPYEKSYAMEYKDNWVKITTVDQGWRYGIMNFNGEVVLKPNFSDISEYTFNGNTLAKVTFPNNSYFYIDTNAKCIEFDNQKCPE